MKDPTKVRGDAAERGVFHAIELLRVLYPWIAAVRFATEAEDASGIDVVITFSHGRTAGLQVKASSGLCKRHRQKYPRIPVVVWDPTDTCIARRQRRHRELCTVLRRMHRISLARGPARDAPGYTPANDPDRNRVRALYAEHSALAETSFLRALTREEEARRRALSNLLDAIELAAMGVPEEDAPSDEPAD